MPRSVAGKELMLTRINGTLYLSTEQCCGLMEISPQNWANRMAAKGGSFQMNPLPWHVIYCIPVQFAAVHAVGGGGGTQLIQFHHPHKVLEEATSIRNAEKRNALVHWLINLGNEVIQQGFAIDQHALANDPNVVEKLRAELEQAKREAKYWEYKYNDAAEYGFDQ
jgi:hypothetical protein